MKKLALLGMAGMLLQFTGCGGSGSGSTTAFAPLAYRTAVVTFSVVSTATLPARINTIKFTAYLPAGIIVPTDPTNPTKISDSALSPGHAVRGAFPPNAALPQPFGSYSAAVRKVTVGLVSVTDFSPGEFVLLTCNIQKNTTLTVNSFTSLNQNLSLGFEAVGIDSSNTTRHLESYLNPFLNVYFGY